MRYASVCSGVEAASLAWMPLGWEAVWFSEIEPFPCAVLKERFPGVPNIGDMTKIEGEKYRGTVDLLVGGTPCQGFSIAGKQEGLKDERSCLALTYCRLLETMRPRWFVWENVPGVFSTNGGDDFKAFLRKIDEIGYSVAWRVLDAQYVRVDGYPRAVPQRRRRVFVVGYLGDWRYPASVLFEPESLPGHSPPRRIKGTGVARSLTASTGGASGKLNQCDFISGDGQPLNAICGVESGKGYWGCGDITGPLRANEGGTVSNVVFGVDGWNGLITGNCSATVDRNCRNTNGPTLAIVCVATGQANAEKTVDCCVNLTCNHEAPIVCAGFMGGQGTAAGGIGYSEECSPTIKASPSGGNQVPDILCVHGSQDPIVQIDHANAINRNNGLENCVCQYGDVAGALTARHDSSPCADRGQNIVCYENHAQDSRVKPCGDCSPQINAKAGTGGNNLPLIQTYAIAENIIGRKDDTGGNGAGAQEELAYTQNTCGVMGVTSRKTVRRLTPKECERLMGFPDDWTRIAWRGKPAGQCPDSPRYKACGNSMCVNVMRWIGMRIEQEERRMKGAKK